MKILSSSPKYQYRRRCPKRLSFSIHRKFFFFRVKAAGGINQTTNLHLVRSSRTSGGNFQFPIRLHGAHWDNVTILLCVQTLALCRVAGSYRHSAGTFCLRFYCRIIRKAAGSFKECATFHILTEFTTKTIRFKTLDAMNTPESKNVPSTYVNPVAAFIFSIVFPSAAVFTSTFLAITCFRRQHLRKTVTNPVTIPSFYCM